MNYFSLRIVSVTIRLAAIATAFFVILLFFVNIDRQFQARNNAQALGRELQSNMAQLEGLLSQIGISIQSSNPAVAQSLSEELFNSLTLRNFQDLFIGLVASLLIFGFGGIIRLLIDIAEGSTQVDYNDYTQPDSNLAPTAPKRWADFPPSPGSNRSPVKPPKAVQPRRPGKWDMGSS